MLHNGKNRQCVPHDGEVNSRAPHDGKAGSHATQREGQQPYPAQLGGQQLHPARQGRPAAVNISRVREADNQMPRNGETASCTYPVGQGGLSTLLRVMEDTYIHAPCNTEADRRMQRREGRQPYPTRQGDCNPCDREALSQATAAAIFLINV